MHSVEIADLLPSVAAGERQAVEACLDRYGALVWSLARRWCPNDSDAEDAVQDIFIELWRNAGRFDPTKASETTFVAMIARRRLIDRRRRQDRLPEMVAMPDDVGGETGIDDASASRMELSADANTAARVLQTMKPDQRRALELAFWHGYTHSEIASAMSMPLGTVKAHVRRGLLTIREQLTGSPILDLGAEGAGSES